MLEATKRILKKFSGRQAVDPVDPVPLFTPRALLKNEYLIEQATRLVGGEDAGTGQLEDVLEDVEGCVGIANRSQFVWVSSEFSEVLGWTCEELCSAPWLEFIHPDDVASTIEVATKMGTEELVGFRNRYRKKSGGYATLMWNAAPWGTGGVTLAVAKEVKTDGT